MVETIRTLEQLAKFVNEDGVLEIVMRNKKKAYKTFPKVMIENLSSGKEKELAEKVIEKLNDSFKLNTKSLKILSNVAQFQKFGLLLNGLNLCATCAGFAVMYAKLDKMSAEINQQINQVKQKIDSAHGVQSNYEFNKVLSEHTNMLDCEKKQQPYSEEQMRQLVDGEYNVLLLLIQSYQKNVVGDPEALIFSIFSLLSMLTVSLRKFDEIYYFNNHEVLEKDNPWHLAHDKWISVYDELSQAWFVNKLQDYGFLDLNLTATQTDAYYLTMTEQIADLKEEVEDNQALLKAFGNEELLKEYKILTVEEISNEVEAAFKSAGADMEAPEVASAFQRTMQQVAMA